MTMGTIAIVEPDISAREILDLTGGLLVAIFDPVLNSTIKPSLVNNCKGKGFYREVTDLTSLS